MAICAMTALQDSVAVGVFEFDAPALPIGHCGYGKPDGQQPRERVDRSTATAASTK